MNTFKIMTWNTEGLKQNIYSLLELLKTHSPSISFLSEIQIFNCDFNLYKKHFYGKYCYSLSAQDMFDPEIPFIHKKHGVEQ